MVAHPGKVIHWIHKVSEYIQKCQLTDPFPSEYPDLIASALMYKRALANRPGTSDILNLAGNDQNGVLKVSLAFWGSKE